MALPAVVDSPKAPRELRGRAGMLRALARGRALATRQPGASRSSYQEALESQVRDFPDEPATGEGPVAPRPGPDGLGTPRGRRGLVLRHQARTSPVARLAAAQGRPAPRGRVGGQKINRDENATKTRMEAARRSLRSPTSTRRPLGGRVGRPAPQASPGSRLTPFAGNPSEAIDACDRVLRMVPPAPSRIGSARLYRIVAQAQAGRMDRGRAGRRAGRVEVAGNPAGPPASPPAAPGPIGGRGGFRDQPSTSRPDPEDLHRPDDRSDRRPPARRSRSGPAPAHASLAVLRGSGRFEEGIHRLGRAEGDVDDPEVLREFADLYPLRLRSVRARHRCRTASGASSPDDRLPPVAGTRLGTGWPLAYYRSDRMKEAPRPGDRRHRPSSIPKAWEEATFAGSSSGSGRSSGMTGQNDGFQDFGLQQVRTEF